MLKDLPTVPSQMHLHTHAEVKLIADSHSYHNLAYPVVTACVAFGAYVASVAPDAPAFLCASYAVEMAAVADTGYAYAFSGTRSPLAYSVASVGCVRSPARAWLRSGRSLRL